MSANRYQHAAPRRAALWRARLVPVVMALIALLTLVPADAAPKQTDAKAQRDEVRKQKVAVAAQIDQLSASSEELQDALDVLDSNLRIEEAALENAEAEVARATAEAAEIQAKQAETQALLDKKEAEVKQVAVEAYAKPPLQDDLLTLDSSDLNEAVRKQALLGIVSNNNIDVTEDVRGLKEALNGLEDERLAALARAEAAKAEVQSRHDVVAQAQSQQQSAVDALDARLDRLLSERQQLETKDKALSAEIQRQIDEAAKAAAKARRKSGGTSTGSAPGGGSVALRTVNGITVNVSIADNLLDLLTAAENAGISLGGSGYRDSSSQISLRRAHCGSSNYDVYEKPAYQCSPPTARPGSSNHERGLAIDFTSGGSVLTRSSAAFKWLQNNAGKYGFRNLPSEPWHWSPDGN